MEGEGRRGEGGSREVHVGMTAVKVYIAMATHHECLLDDVSLLVWVPPLLGDDEGVVEQEHSPLLQHGLGCLLDRKHVLCNERKRRCSLRATVISVCTVP